MEKTLGVDFDVLLHCNFAEEHVDITKLQPFYQNLVKAWISVNGADKKPLSDFGVFGTIKI